MEENWFTKTKYALQNEVNIAKTTILFSLTLNLLIILSYML